MTGPADRRSKERYPIKLGVRYRALGRPGVAGMGETANLSSLGSFIATPEKQELIVGSRMEAVMEWPILLEGTTSLELVILGKVARVDEEGFAFSFGRHKFRTAKRRPARLSIDQDRQEAG